MTAYLVAQIDVTDPARYADYGKAAFPVVAQYGGTFRAKAGATVALEGPAPRERIVIIEFADRVAAERYYHSPEYQAAKRKRDGGADAQFFIVDGA